MAAGLRRSGGKTNVFWSKDADDVDDRVVKVFVPGLSLEPPHVKQPMVRKPAVHMKKVRNSTLQKSMRENTEQRTRHDMSDVGKVSSQSDPHLGKITPEEKQGREQLTLKDLNPQDKKRVANLVRELAKVGEEREVAFERLGKERSAFEERLNILQEEYYAVTKEKEYMQNRFIQLQSLLKKYNHQGTGDMRCSPRKTTDTAGQRAEHVQVPRTVSVSKRSPQSSLEVFGNTRSVIESSNNLREKHSPAKQAAGRRSPFYDEQENQPDEQQSRETHHHQQQQQHLQQQELQQNQRQHQQLQQQRQQDKQQQHDKQQQDFQHQQRQHGQEQRHEHQQPSVELASNVFKDDVPVLSELRVTEATTERGSIQNPMRGVSSQESGDINGKPQSTTSAQVPVSSAESRSQALPHHQPIRVTSAHPGQPFDGQLRDASRERSFSETSATSQNFSAELDAVYRLYCREYELQLQLQHQQLELQRQQLQLQQQLQQMELLQQQQQTRARPLVADQVTNPYPSVKSQTVVMETPTPSSAPRPAAQPRLMSPATTLDPTPDVSQVLAADASQTELLSPRMSKLPPRDARQNGPADTNPMGQIQAQQSAVSVDRQAVTDVDDIRRRVSRSSITSPPLGRNSRDFMIRVPPHQDEAVLSHDQHSGHFSHGLANSQSLPLFEGSVELFVPGPTERRATRSSVGMAHSLQGQRKFSTGDVNERKSKPTVQRLVEGKENYAPSGSSKFGSWVRPPSSSTSHLSLGSCVEQEQGKTRMNVALTERRRALPQSTAHSSVARNFSFSSDFRDEHEQQEATRWNSSGDHLYALYDTHDADSRVHTDVPSAEVSHGRNDGQVQDTRIPYPRSIIDLVQGMESIVFSENSDSEASSSFENLPMSLRRSAFEEHGRYEPIERTPEHRDRSLREKFNGGLDEDVEETRLLENIFFVSERR